MTHQFHPLLISDIVQETSDSIVVTLTPDDKDREHFRFQPGQHLTLRTEIDGDDVRRNYSLCVSPRDEQLRIGIKRVAGGLFSNWAASNFRIGGTVEAMPPRGRFTWLFETERRRRYVAFAGGSGITPILSLFKTGLETELESRFTLFYGNRDSASIMFLEELGALKDRYLDRLGLYHFLDNEDGGVDLFYGQLTEERASAALEHVIGQSGIDAAFICGPGPMMDGAERALLAKGADPEAILIERFSAGSPVSDSPRTVLAPASTSSGLRYEVIIDGRRRSVLFDPADGNFLDNVRAAGLPAPFACKAGVCATCRAKLRQGSVEMPVNYGLTKKEVDEGYILTCQSFPTDAGVVIDYDA